MGTHCDMTDVKPVIKLLPNFVKSVLIMNCCDVIGHWITGMGTGMVVFKLYL